MNETTIIVTTEPDLHTIHGDGNRAAYCVHFAFAGDEDTTRKLLARRNWEFAAYKLVADGGGFKAVRQDDITVEMIGGDEGISTETVMNWLKNRGAQFGQPAAGRSDEIDPTKANAAQLLQGTIAWDAPLPQAAGLTRLAFLKPAKDFSEVFLLPVSVDEIPGVDEPHREMKNGSDVEVRFTLEIWGNLKFDVVFRTVMLGAYDAAPPKPVRDDGFLEKGWCDDDYRFLEALGGNAASLFASLPALLALPEKDVLDRLDAKELALVGCQLALDSLLTSLLFPVPFDPGANKDTAPDAQCEGAILGPWMTLIALHKPAGGQPKPVVQEELAKLRTQIAQVVKELNNDEAGSATIKKGLLSLMFGRDAQTIPDPSTSLDPVRPTDESDVLFEALGGPSTDNPKLITTATVIDGLRILSAKLQRESELEPVLCNLLRLAIAVKENEIAADGLDVLRTTFPKYWELVHGPFNGADAVRQDCGRVFVARVLHKKNKDGKDFLDTIEDLRAWRRRLNIDDDVESNWWNFLPVVDLKNAAAPAGEILDKTWTQFVRQSLPETSDTAKISRRFVPDTSPQPIAIPIATVNRARNGNNPDDEPVADDLDAFTQRFNGVGVLLKRLDPNGNGTSKWAHANLVKHLVYKPKPPEQTNGNGDVEFEANPAIRPFLPVAPDGRREMFIRYHGVPLSSPAYDQTMPAIAQSSDKTNGDKTSKLRIPFSTIKDAVFQYPNVNPNSFQPPPRLAYGCEYRSCAFAVTKAGALPKSLQGGKPWLPNANVQVPVKDENGNLVEDPEVIARTQCLRRTAIGSTTIANAPGYPARIGGTYPDVWPLAADAPRLVIAAMPGGSGGFVDLFRNIDGTGQLKVENEGTPFTLEGLKAFRDNTADNTNWSLQVEVHNLAATDFEAQPIERKTVDGATVKATCKFTIKENNPTPNDAPKDEGEVIPIPQGVQGPFWVRVRLISAQPLSLSFAIARHDQIERTGTLPDSPPVLLVAKKNDVWSKSFSEPARAVCVLPRVTRMDWDRWFSNSSLPLYGWDRNDPNLKCPDKNNNIVLTPIDWTAIDVLFLEASIVRSEDLEIAALLDRLPDPAVCGFVAELLVVDTLATDTPAANKFMPKSQLIEYEPTWLCEGLKAENLDNFKGKVFLEKLKQNLKKIDNTFQFPVLVNAAGDTTALHWDKSIRQLTCSVPAGVVAQLSVRPIVLKNFFGRAFHPRMTELAVEKRQYNGPEYLVFPGATLTIESMFSVHIPNGNKTDDNAKTLAKGLIQQHLCLATPPGLRGYDILTSIDSREVKEVDNSPADSWRCFSHLDIHTQRWRFSGRPIYHWINPRDHLAENACGGNGSAGNGNTASPAALELKCDDPAHNPNHKEVLEFEQELFFDRDDGDRDIRQVRLMGAGESLHQVRWESPTATYYRHGFRLLSRYRGAMLPGKGTPALPAKGAPWTRRMAILADGSRLEITSPQVRCLVPLSACADVRADAVIPPPDPARRAVAPSPPIACLLEERPYAVGGLADRILAEFLVRPGYGFVQGKDQVQPLDFGKETSRDPRIAAWSWIPHRDKGNNFSGFDPSQSFVLEAEGPVGLHFERGNVPAPAWSNCQYVLHPRSLDGRIPLPEESFLAVRLHRRLDPNWVVGNGQAPANNGRNGTPGQGENSGQKDCVSANQNWVADFEMSVFNSAVSSAKGAPQPNGGCLLSAKTKVDGAWSGQKTEILNWSIEHGETGKILKVKVPPKVIAGPDKENLVLCAIPIKEGDELWGIQVLHVSHADGGYTATVSAIPRGANRTAGRINVPLPLASVQWQLPKENTANSTAKSVETEIEFPSAMQIASVTVSPATAREWARTARNSEWVNQLNIETKGSDSTGDVGPIRIDDLLFRTTNGKEMQITRKNNPVWIAASQTDSLMPLHVQRHLVAVFTSHTSGAGRRTDLYCSAQFLTGKNPVLGGPETTPATGVSLCELEVPAGILSNVDVKQFPALKDYQQAYFDLMATGGLPTNNGTSRQYRVHVRFANSRASMAEVKSIKLTIKMKIKMEDEPVKLQKSEFELKAESGGRTIRGCDLIWPKSKTENKIAARVHFWNGDQPKELTPQEWKDLPDNADDSMPLNAVSVEITEPIAGGNREIWADASLLHREVTGESNPDFDAFDFDWLFSQGGEGNTLDSEDPSFRVSPEALIKLTEAQARIVSQSKIIPINSR